MLRELTQTTDTIFLHQSHSCLPLSQPHHCIHLYGVILSSKTWRYRGEISCSPLYSLPWWPWHPPFMLSEVFSALVPRGLRSAQRRGLLVLCTVLGDGQALAPEEIWTWKQVLWIKPTLSTRQWGCQRGVRTSHTPTAILVQSFLSLGLQPKGIWTVLGKSALTASSSATLWLGKEKGL